MLGLFGHKKRVDKLKDEVEESFNHVKKDFNKVGEWIKHLDAKHVSQADEVVNIKDQLLTIHEDLMELKDFISFFGPQISKGLSKQPQTNRGQRSMSDDVQTVVQTPVQTPKNTHLNIKHTPIRPNNRPNNN